MSSKSRGVDQDYDEIVKLLNDTNADIHDIENFKSRMGKKNYADASDKSVYTTSNYTVDTQATYVGCNPLGYFASLLFESPSYENEKDYDNSSQVSYPKCDASSVDETLDETDDYSHYTGMHSEYTEYTECTSNSYDSHDDASTTISHDDTRTYNDSSRFSYDTFTTRGNSTYFDETNLSYGNSGSNDLLHSTRDHVSSIFHSHSSESKSTYHNDISTAASGCSDLYAFETTSNIRPLDTKLNFIAERDSEDEPKENYMMSANKSSESTTAVMRPRGNKARSPKSIDSASKHSTSVDSASRPPTAAGPNGLNSYNQDNASRTSSSDGSKKLNNQSQDNASRTSSTEGSKLSVRSARTVKSTGKRDDGTVRSQRSARSDKRTNLKLKIPKGAMTLNQKDRIDYGARTPLRSPRNSCEDNSESGNSSKKSSVKSNGRSKNKHLMNEFVPKKPNNKTKPHSILRSGGESNTKGGATIALNYETDPVLLYRSIDTRQWKLALNCLKTNPNEAKTWVYRQDENGEILWKFLPIHAACFSGAPSMIIKALISACPQTVREKVNGDKLPIHIACETGAHRDSVVSLLEAYPDSLCVRDCRKSTALDLCMNGSSKNKAQLIRILTNPGTVIPSMKANKKRARFKKNLV